MNSLPERLEKGPSPFQNSPSCVVTRPGPERGGKGGFCCGNCGPRKHLMVATLNYWRLQERESQNRLKFRTYVIEALRSYTKD
jgi:hypothetical protein